MTRRVWGWEKQSTLQGTPMETLNSPLLETPTEYILHGFSCPNYLADLGPQAQSEIYTRSSIDLALRDAFRKMRRFLMTTQGLSEDEAVSLMSVGVDFGVTQVVDGNWGIHAILKKSLFAAGEISVNAPAMAAPLAFAVLLRYDSPWQECRVVQESHGLHKYWPQGHMLILLPSPRERRKALCTQSLTSRK
jgi:hypothetical protein